ncbi:MAG: patatin-like phospholipase family protein [Thaumarchaeota archaeon]|nr:patatin-like phospholipase family protein [Nitrososphaerota archaeon]
MQSLSSREKQNLQFETVLVLQGGGSLGAYECGVYKALHRHGIKFDIVAGTSIGAVNASIITGSRSDEPAKALEEFWLDLAEGVTSPGLPDNIRPYFASMYSAFFGNPKMFFPKWFIPSADYFMPYFWQYMYDITPLKKTLDQYVDFQKIQSPKKPRLIITSTDIQNAKPSVFDSKYDHIEADHVLASAGYPFYGISWTQKSGKYLWDGTLLSNTPLREVINASPKLDKNVYVVDLFPKNQPELPNNMFEVWHRARDIIHTDKTEHNIHMSKTITRYLKLIREMHEILSSSTLDEKDKSKLALLEQEYHKLASERGSIINQIVRIQRHEHVHFLLEDADFSIATIKELIEKGEKDAKEALVTNNVE